MLLLAVVILGRLADGLGKVRLHPVLPVRHVIVVRQIQPWLAKPVIIAHQARDHPVLQLAQRLGGVVDATQLQVIVHIVDRSLVVVLPIRLVHHEAADVQPGQQLVQAPECLEACAVACMRPLLKRQVVVQAANHLLAAQKVPVNRFHVAGTAQADRRRAGYGAALDAQDIDAALDHIHSLGRFQPPPVAAPRVTRFLALALGLHAAVIFWAEVAHVHRHHHARLLAAHYKRRRWPAPVHFAPVHLGAVPQIQTQRALGQRMLNRCTVNATAHQVIDHLLAARPFAVAQHVVGNELGRRALHHRQPRLRPDCHAIDRRQLLYRSGKLHTTVQHQQVDRPAALFGAKVLELAALAIARRVARQRGVLAGKLRVLKITLLARALEAKALRQIGAVHPHIQFVGCCLEWAIALL